PVREARVAPRAAQHLPQANSQRGYFSHWNPEGLKPTRRYNLLGGFHALGENIYYFHGPFTTVEAMVDGALDKLMGSEGHRKTILGAAYTHVGLYFAANAG